MSETNTGRGRGRSGNGNRSYNRQGRGRNANQKHKKKIVLPDDAVAELGDNIYVINQAGQADKFVKTTETILNYVQKTYKNGEDMREALDSLVEGRTIPERQVPSMGCNIKWK